MTTPLFRTIQPDAQNMPGLLHLRSPGWATLTAFLAASVILAAVFIASMPYARRQPAIGLVVPEGGAVRVTAPQPGTLLELFVADGALVEAGTALFSLGYGRSLQDGGSLQASLRQALDRQEALLQEQIASEAIRVGHERSGLDSRLAGLEAERQNLDGQRALLEQRVRVAADRFQSVAELRRRGLITETDFRAREDAWLTRRQDLAAAEQRLDAIAHGARQVALQLAQLPADSLDRIARLRGAVAELQQQKAQAAAQGGAVVRAPVAGRVTALQAAIGQQLDPAKPLMSLVPAEAAMHAELFVPPRAIGFVRPGQAVRLTYDAFPLQRFGAHGGVIDSVSATMLTPEEVTGPLRPQGPAYRVSVRLDRQHVTAGLREMPLQPDMTLRADIVLERRTVLDWALEPLSALLVRMRS